MGESEVDRIEAGVGGQLVHERLDREHVEVRAERAHRRRAQRRLGDAVPGDPAAADVVERYGVAKAAESGCRGRVGRRWQGSPPPTVRHRQQPGLAGVPRTRGVALAPHVVRPALDPAVDQARRDRRGHRRGERTPRQLVAARPPQQHRATGDGACQEDGVEGRVVGGVVAVAPGVLDVLDAHGGRVQRQGGGDRPTQGVDALAVAPDVHRRTVVAPACHRTARRDRGVGQVGLGVRRRVRRLAGAVVDDDLGGSLGADRRYAARSSSSGSESCSSQVAALASATSARSTSSSRTPITPRNEPSRTSETPGDDQPSGSGSAQRGGRRRRTQDPGVEQTFRPEVAEEPRPSEHLVGHVEPRYVGAHRRARDRRVDVDGRQVGVGVESPSPGPGTPSGRRRRDRPVGGPPRRRTAGPASTGRRRGCPPSSPGPARRSGPDAPAPGRAAAPGRRPRSGAAR